MISFLKYVWCGVADLQNVWLTSVLVSLFLGTSNIFIWVQLRTGKIGLNKYLHAIGRAESPACNRRHVLWDCPAQSLQAIRPAFLNKCTNLREALTNAQYATSITNYMVATGLLGQFSAVKPTAPN